MNFDKYSHRRDLFRMLGGVGLILIPLLVVLYMGPHSLPGVQAGQVHPTAKVSSMSTIEQSTRAILSKDLDEAWAHYESGEYGEAMWKQVHAHVTRNWDRQAQGKGWRDFGWNPPKDSDEASRRPPVIAHQR